MLSQITAKSLKLAIKRGMTPESLEEKYKVSEQELFRKIAQIYDQGSNKASNEIINSLKENRKIHRKSNPQVEQPIVTEKQETVTSEVKPVEDLPTLKKREEEISLKLVKYEGYHKDCASNRRTAKKRLEDLLEKIKSLETTLLEHRQTFEEILEYANDQAAEMNDLCEPIRKMRAELDEVRSRIKELETITFYVYNDGSIETPEHPEFVINDEGYQEIKAKLLDKDECLDLTVRDITILARLLVATKAVTGFSIVCENERIETAFYALRN